MTTIIETERLILRTWRKEDVESYFAIQSKSENNEFFSRSLSLEETKNLLNHLNEYFQEFNYTLWATEVKDNQKLIGYIGLSNADFKESLKSYVDIGFLIDSQYQNMGLATEGAKACVEYGFKLGMREIISYTPSINLKAIKVVEKIGLKRDLNGDFAHPKLPSNHKLSHHVLYRISAEESKLPARL